MSTASARSLRGRTVLAVLFTCIVLLPARLAPAVVRSAPYALTYTISPHPSAAASPPHTDVELTIGGLAGEKSVQLQMPVWSPGDYHVMNHGRFVRDFAAFAAKDKPLTVTRPDENTWDVTTEGEDAVRVRYSLPVTPPGFFSENVMVRDRYAFYNGPATYMYVVGHKQDPATLRIRLPQGWKGATTPLEPVTSSAADPASVEFKAPDYDMLVDSPLVAGDFAERTFNYAGRPHTLVFFNAHQGMDYASLLPVVQRIVAEENRLMGGLPYPRYSFFIDVNGRGGGLEHLNAQRIAWSKGLPVRFAADFVGHEFFHLWNVKRVRPLALGPFDYVHPPKTRNLWWSEGVTEYFAELSSLRAGLHTEAEFLEQQAGAISALQNTPARLRVTADESSLRVWEAGNSSGYGGLSYYLKGQLIGLCLDLKLRHITSGRASLDGVMRDLMARYGLPKPGFPEDGLRDAVVRAGGEEMGPFYDKLARSMDEMPFAECLGYAGFALEKDGSRYKISMPPQADADSMALRQAWMKGR
jgi:predicted metalloprotease with PDZ domain